MAPTEAPTTEAPAAQAPVQRPRRDRQRRQLSAVNVFSHAFLLLWSLLAVFPLIWVIATSFRPDIDIITKPFGLPTRPDVDNWVRAWTEARVGRYLWNTVLVLSGSLTLTMLFGAMAAYVLARYKFWGNRIIYYAFVGGMAFPIFLAFVPLFFVVDNLGQIPVIGQYIELDTLGSLVLVYTAFSLPFTVFFLTAFFRTLPTQVAEAALVDGCGHFRLFFRVMLPMAKPGLISVGIFNFLGQWNQFVLPFVLVRDKDKYVLAQGIWNLAVQMGYNGDWGALFAGLTIAMLPVLIVYLVFQRQLQKGLAAGNVLK